MAIYPEINNEYERLKIRRENAVVSRIEALYSEFSGIIAPYLTQNLPRTILTDILNRELKSLVGKVTAEVHAGIQTAWGLANRKTFAYLDKRLAGYDLPEGLKKVFYDPNEDAMKQFIRRKAGGMSISERVWDGAKSTKRIIKKQLSDGIYEGKSAAYTARVIREGLNNPDKFFRRVRNSKGELVESKPSKAFHPGQGVYKSPVKNSERLTRTEINRAYRTADQVAWENNPMILGYEIRLSASNKAHIRCELCRTLAGKYPASFQWAGWHPQCLCYKIPILMSREQMDRYQALVAGGNDYDSAVESIRKQGGLVSQPPSALGAWVKGNEERVNGWANKPYWWQDNLKLVEGFLKK